MKIHYKKLKKKKKKKKQTNKQTNSITAKRKKKFFERIRDLVIELPAGDLKLDRNAVVKWRAEFGKTLENYVIFAFRDVRPSTSTQIPAEFADLDFAGGLKLRVGDGSIGRHLWW